MEQQQTAADIKRQIEVKTEDLKNSGLPITGQVANEINATESRTASTDVKPQPETAAKGVEVPESADKAALQDWAKKKGIDWTTEDSVLSALRKSDQAFHEKRNKERTNEPANQPGYTAPSYTPPPSYQPGYQPNYQQTYQPPVNNRSMLENLGRQYNMAPEDVERMLALNKDFFEVAMRSERERFSQELEGFKRENKKNTVFRELSSDPIFRKPEVAVEFHRVLEEMQSQDPQSFENNPDAYVKAYDKTLINMARKNLQGQPLEEGVPPVARPPLTPPRNYGKGSGGGSMENENQIDMAAYLKAPSSEKKKILEKMGLVSEQY